jgi:glycosyltransferase involved in cell wall biosynthesis
VASTFAKTTFVEHGIAEHRIAVTPYGVDQSDYYPVPKTDETFRILFVGSLCLRKGLPYLLDSVSRLKFRNAEFVLRGGDTPTTAMILSQYAGSIPLRIVGPLPRARMKELFSQASVMVLPSIEDGFGLVIAQAMACGVPVIASTHTGGPDLIADGVEGFIVQPRDSKSLGQRLTELYEDRELLARMAHAALSRINTMGGWSAYGDAVERAYRSVVRTLPSGAASLS